MKNYNIEGYKDSLSIFNKTPDNDYTIKIPEFEGPLDLLLYLIKNSEVNIYDICISDITKQYLEYLSLLITVDPDNMSEFIEMAKNPHIHKIKEFIASRC